jgi:hypothetical protein
MGSFSLSWMIASIRFRQVPGHRPAKLDEASRLLETPLLEADRLLIRFGKHVLAEKPVTLNEREAAMIEREAARARCGIWPGIPCDSGWRAMSVTCRTPT